MVRMPSKRLFAIMLWTGALIAFVLAVWLVGPLIAIAGHVPLESVFARCSVIAVGIALLGVRVLISSGALASLSEALRTRRAARKSPEQSSPNLQAIAADGLVRQALAILRTARLRSNHTWLGRLGKAYVYELPWCVLLGSQGVGKTTAIRNAGIPYSTSLNAGNGEPSSLAGFECLVTEAAVLVDPVGPSRDLGELDHLDRERFDHLLKALTKHRGRRPLDGVVAMISAADLVDENPAQATGCAQLLRERLHALRDRTGQRLPVYVVITQCDRIQGFVDFFDQLTKEERESVWGFTLPWPAAASADDRLATIVAGLTQLARRLNERLVERLQAERQVSRRCLIYGFPSAWQRMQDRSVDFLRELCATLPVNDDVWLRGVYFVSAQQQAICEPPSDTDGAQAAPVIEAAGSSGRSFFLTRLLREVVFAEGHMVGTRPQWERRRRQLRLAVAATCIVAILGGVSAWSVSYRANRDYVQSVANNVALVGRSIADVSARGAAQPADLLPLLRDVRSVASPFGGYDLRSWTMRFGLYQGAELQAHGQSAYTRLLQDALLPSVIRRIESLIAVGPGQSPELHYEAVKAYVMLHDPARLNRRDLRSFIAADWQSALPAALTSEQRRELDGHLERLLALDALVAPFPSDTRLLASAREAIARVPLAERIYGRLRRQGLGAEFPEFSVARAAGPAARLVFKRASGTSIDRGVPGLFSFTAYHKAFRTTADTLARRLADEEAWVLGLDGSKHAAAAAARRDTVADEVRRLYLEDYYRHWRAFVDDLRISTGNGLDANIQAARVLSSATESPLPPLIRAILREVTLAAAIEGDKTLVDRGRETIDRGREEMSKLFGARSAAVAPAAPGSLAEQLVDQRFDELRRLVSSNAPGQPTPLEETLRSIGDLYGLLLSQQAALKNRIPPPPTDVPRRLAADASRLPEPIRTMLLALASAGAQEVQLQAVAAVSDAVRSELLDFCQRAVDQRYPFVRSAPGSLDATPEDFAALFAPGGKFDEVFQKTLAPFVDTAARPWRFKAGDAPNPIRSAALPQFQRAAVIREVFFRNGSRMPNVRLELRPLEMDATITHFTLDVDGQLVRYSHGPQVTQSVQWPGSGSRRMVRVAVQPPAASGVSALNFEGPWALFRLFDAMQVEAGRAPEKFTVTFNIEGRRARFEVLAASVLNPFRLPELADFRCPRGL